MTPEFEANLPSMRELVHRPRVSPWPAIPLGTAFSLVKSVFYSALEDLQTVDEIDMNMENSRESIDDLLGAILAEEILATSPVPAFPVSIKDGYAVLASDGAGNRRVVGQSLAEILPSCELGLQRKIKTGECVRITTGAPLPPGSDAIVQVENTELIEHDGKEELLINIIHAPKHRQDIREIGSDVNVGDVLLRQSTVIGAAEVGLLALSGRRTVQVFRRPKIAVLSTGDELVNSYSLPTKESGTEALSAVIDTNRPMLLSLFRSNKFETFDAGIAPDRKEVIQSSLEKAFSCCDVVVVTGGVSMGEKDFLKEILRDYFNFTIHFGRVYMKPGLPTTFASGRWPLMPDHCSLSSRCKFVFALPGNPVSAFVTAHLFVVPMLRRISGLSEVDCWHTKIAVQLAHSIDSVDKRPEYRRARLVWKNEGRESDNAIPLAECIAGSHCSSRLPSTASANLLVELPPRTETCQRLEKGSVLSALIIGQL